VPSSNSKRVHVPVEATLADFPQLAAELDPAAGAPESIRARGRQSVPWRCTKGGDHLWEAPPNRRASAGAGCPFCAGKRASTTNSLAALFPEVAAELDLDAPATRGLTAHQIVAGSHQHLGWCCRTCGHRWVAGVGPRTGRSKAGCPGCSGAVPTETTNLAVVRRDIAAQWHPTLNEGLAPDRVMPGSSTKAWWKCSAGDDHVWRASPNARTRLKNPTGCPCCAGYQLSTTNSLAALYPDVAAQLDPDLNQGQTPDRVLAGTSAVCTWRCPNGPDHVWESAVVARTKAGNGCPFCSNRRASVTNSLALRPELVAEFDADANAPHTPESLSQSARRKVWWACPHGSDHRWQTSVAARARSGTGCPFCQSHRVSVTNSLATRFPDIAWDLVPALNDSRTAHDYTATSRELVTWQCTAGHTWTVSVIARTRAAANGHGGCPECYPVGASLRQLAIASALAHSLSGLAVDTRPPQLRDLAGNAWHPDILVPALRLVIEYDGSFYHRGREEHDANKSNALRAAGWQVVRLREAPLERLTHHDLPVEAVAPAQADKLMSRILGHLRETLDDQSRELLEAELSSPRPEGAPRWQWTSPPPKFERYLQALQAFAVRKGHARPSDTHKEDGLLLGRWVIDQRRLYREGKLPDLQVRLLDSVPGWTWDYLEFRWQLFTAALDSFAARHGHLRIPQSHVENGFSLGTKVANVRVARRRGTLSAERTSELEARPGWTWTPRSAASAAVQPALFNPETT
jgi:hypothetical protein